MSRFQQVFFQIVIIGLLTFFFVGEYPAYLTTAFLLLYVFLISNPYIDANVLQSMMPLEKPFLIASKCACLDGPENTLGAAKQAIKMGVKAIHFQVRLTADEIPIVYGHSLLEVKTNGTGKVRDVTYNFLAMLNASVMDDNQKCFPDEKIPRLEEMMELCLTNRILMVIELRGRPAELVAAVKILFKRNALLHKHVIAISDHPYLIYVLRRNIPTLLCGLIYRKNRMSEKLNGNAHSNFIYFGYFLMDWLFEWSCKYWLWYVCGNTFIFAYRSHVSEAMVEHYLKFGIVTVVWPVNVEVEKDYFMKALRCPVMTETLSHEIIHTRSVSLDSLKAAEIQKLLVAENLRHRESINKKLQIHVSKKDS